MAEHVPKNPITAAALFEADRLPKDACLDGDELEKACWRIRGMLKEKARQEQFWASSSQGLEQAYRALEQRSRERKEARQELLNLNQELEARVAEQVQEILRGSHEVEALNTQLPRGCASTEMQCCRPR